MKKRQDKIQSEMDTAANEKADAIAYKAEYDEKLSKVDDEANEILNTARKKALKKESEIVQDAKDEAVRIMNRAKKEAELEKNKVKDQVKQEMIDIAITAAGKMVSVSIDENKQAELISDTLKEMGEETWQS